MTSQESIGSCSLDVEQSASDRSEDTIDTVSKKALHSLNLSCNGDSVSSADNRTNGSSETLQKSHLTVDEKLNVSNGHRGSPGPEQLTVKKPSYLGLACSISGYSGINRYDSKLREGFRSRDSSPGTRLIARETSPAGFRSNEHLNVPVHPYPPKSQSISPLAMDRQNGFSNGLKEECKIETYRESRSSIAICQGYSEVDKGVLYTTFPDISPIRSNASAKRSPGMSPMMSCSQQNKHFAGSSPKHTTANLSNTSFSDTSILNGSSTEGDSRAMNNSSNSEKSFIQQRVERLYGPGALAQGFFFKRSTSRLNASDSSFNKSSNNNDVSTENANTEESLKNLPVLRHLRPEFRAQLPVASPRRPTDGSEQTLKPLQRVTPVSRKVEQKGKLPAATHLDGSLADSSGQKLNSSVTSIPDQQPAAPKVVLPVLEPSASSTSVAKQVQEAEQTEVEEKDGHYFTTLLKRETDRLLSLAASAEAELASGDTVALPEEAAGKLRSAAGKARLLASQKMQQFEGLCQKNINQVPGEEFPTTDEDLAGFWDMVMLQVVQVNDLFDQIEKLRNSQWQEVCSDSIYPQTSLSTRTPEKPSRCHVKIDKVKPAKLPSCRSSSHSVNDKHSRFDVMLFNEQDESPHLLNNSLQLSEQFPLEARLCNDVFQVLNLPDHLEEDELYCANFDEDSNPFVSDCITNVHAIENDSLPVNPCTSYIVNYLNLLQHNTDPFYLEKPEHASYNFYPRGDYFKDNFYDHDLTHKSSDVKVIFENEQKNNDFSNVSEYKSRESIPEYSPKPSTEEKDGMPDVKSTFLSDKENKSVERKLENPRSKAKSCSSVGRNLNHDAQIKSRGKIGSRTPGKKYQKNDSIKSDTDGQHKYRNSKSVIASKKNEEKVLVSSKNYKSHDKSSLLSRKENVKKRGHSVKFSDNIQEFPESEKQISVDNCKGGKVKKVSLQPVLGKPEKKTHPTKMKNIKQVNNNCDEKMNLSVMTEVWSNLDTQGHKRKSQGIVDKTPKKNCTFSETPNMKKYVKHFVIEHVEESPKKVECGTDNASEISDIIWRLSDSKPFIPLSQEVLRQLREVYNVENQSSVSLNLERSKKLERMKLYDKKRKLILKKQGDGTPRKVISRRSSWHPLINPPINPYASRNLQDSIDATTEIRKPISENRNISVQCLIDTTNFKPCVINKENELTLLNSITDNISDCPEKYKTQDVLSGMVCSLNSEIMSSVTKQSSITLKNRESVRNLRCGIIAETYKSPNINTNVFVTISHHVHSDFVVRSLPDRTVGKGIELIHFNNYLPLRRELYADRYPKDLKYIPLLPQNIHVHSNPSDLKTFPIKIKHLCTFVKSNRTLCRLSLYLYMYGILSLVLIFMKMGSSNEYLLDSRIFYNLY